MNHRYRSSAVCVLLLVVASICELPAQTGIWTRLNPPANAPLPVLHATHFFTADSGYVAGGRGTSLALYFTSNGGTSWTQRAIPAGTGELQDIFFLPNSSFAVVAGDNDYVAYSTDRGATWERRGMSVFTAGGNVNAIHFRDPQNGFAVGKALSGNGPRFARTTNGGISWIDVPQSGSTSNLWDLDFFDANRGVAVGTGSDARKSRTTDGGLTWEAAATMGIPYPFSTSIYGVDAVSGTGVAYASGGRIGAPMFPLLRKTTDHGATWQVTALEDQNRGYQPARDVLALSEREVLVSAQNMTIYRSVDGGATWRKDSLAPGLPTSYELRRFSRAADRSIVLVGEAGVVLRYIPPGNCLAIDPAVSRDAGSIRVGSGFNTSLVLTNILLNSSSDCYITIHSVTLARGIDFSNPIMPGRPFLGPGERRSIAVEFAPTALCRRYDTIVVHHSGVDSPARIPVQGTGVEPTFATRPSDTLDFGNVVRGRSSVDTLRLSNDLHTCLDSTRISRF